MSLQQGNLNKESAMLCLMTMVVFHCTQKTLPRAVFQNVHNLWVFCTNGHIKQSHGGLLRTKIKRSTSQSEDHSDKEFYEIAALVGCSACFHFGTEQGE